MIMPLYANSFHSLRQFLRYVALSLDANALVKIAYPFGHSKAERYLKKLAGIRWYPNSECILQ